METQTRPRYASGRYKDTVNRAMDIYRAKNRHLIRRRELVRLYRKHPNRHPLKVTIDKYDLKYSPEAGWF